MCQAPGKSAGLEIHFDIVAKQWNKKHFFLWASNSVDPCFEYHYPHKVTRFNVRIVSIRSNNIWIV